MKFVVCILLRVFTPEKPGKLMEICQPGKLLEFCVRPGIFDMTS